ncbi:hypothetical protein A2U01_0108196, partial [Trifolium medium]|nr:hypothetical protein [Trifolium medium]
EQNMNRTIPDLDQGGAEGEATPRTTAAEDYLVKRTVVWI